MNEIMIRQARTDEASWVVEMIHRMVAEMASHGGHAAGGADAAKCDLEQPITDELRSEDSHYLVAESPQHERVGVVGAELKRLAGAFAPKQVIEIMLLYVIPSMRGRASAVVC